MTMTQGVSGFDVGPILWSADWAWGLPLIVVTVVFHVLGLGFTYQKAVKLYWRKKDRSFPTIFFVMVMSTVIFLATALHAAETMAWAGCYEFLGARPDFKTSMLYSLGAMTTFGAGAGLTLEPRWQLLGSIEALSGWLLFGLTTAFLFGTIQKCHEITIPD
jgi:hypothetical protein